jgi:chromate reductase, NAD(P)H dehydrogenase (quinone)
MRIYAISGSLRAASVHSALLRAVQACAPDGMEIEICDLIGEIPIFNPDLEGALTPAPVARLAEKIGAADVLIFACPEYAHGIPGGLKNALDWLVSRPELVGKPFVLTQGYQGRGEYVRAALTEVLTTASLIEIPGSNFDLPLVGKKGEALADMLNAPETTAIIGAMLAQISDWCFERYAV